MTSYDKLFIGGRWTASAGSEVIEVHSPHDQSLVGTVPHAGPADVDAAVAAAREAFDNGPWPRLTPEQRQETVKRFQELYSARAAEMAALITAENGSPISITTGLNVHGLPEQTGAYLRAAENLQWEERLASGALLRREAVGVVAAVKTMMESLTVGDPSDPATFIGPMVRADQQQRVRSYIELGIAEGARLVTGGPQVPEGLEGGFYVTPTLFADVDNSMRIAREEIFGPVLVVIPFDDEDDAIRIANDSDYGLGGGVWSADRERALAVARRVRTGLMLVNGAMPAFDGPFGGFKASGVGREFGAVGLNQYIEHKTIAV